VTDLDESEWATGDVGRPLAHRWQAGTEVPQDVVSDVPTQGVHTVQLSRGGHGLLTDCHLRQVRHTTDEAGTDIMGPGAKRLSNASSSK
jgi:hypothetical protein